MPIRSFVSDRSFDPETIEIMNTAFLAVCAERGLADKTDGACAIVAKRVIEVMGGQRDPEAIRAAVLASISAKPD